MKVNIKYFGMIAESVGKTEEVLELENQTSVQELKEKQIKKYRITDPEAIQLAVNKNLNQKLKLKEGDEVAFLPPFAGG